MSDFASKYKKNIKGGNTSKDNKKAVTKALHETFKRALDGQVAGINHNGEQFLMMKQTVFQDIIKNGGKVLLTEEQKFFHQQYQILMHMMGSLKIEDDKESEIFDEIDQFSFDFSQIMNDPNAQKKRTAVVKEFKEVIAKYPLLIKMEQNLMKQMTPQEDKKDNGKLT